MQISALNSACWAVRVLPLCALVALGVGGAPAEARQSQAAARAESPDRARVRRAAEKEEGLHIVVSVAGRRLEWKHGAAVLGSAPVAVGKDSTLTHRGRSWDFATPVGVREVLGKQENPVWVPPDWHYVELARAKGYRLVALRRDRDEPLRDGSRLRIRDGRVERVHADGTLEPIPTEEEIIYDAVVYIPPLGTESRRIPGELGRYKLDLGDGYLIHGTPHQDSIGQAVTHGCIRMRDEDLAALFRSVPVGTPVYIY